MAHSHHMHREHQVSHRRVHHILKEHPEGATKHAKSHAFSKVTSKTAVEHHDAHVAGKKMPKRLAYARGGKVKGKGHQTNIAIVVPHHGAGAPLPGAPGGPMPPPPGGAPPMPGGPPGMPPPGGPPGMPPGMPMRKAGGRIKNIDGEATKGNIDKWEGRASKNSYKRGGHVLAGAATGVGREQQYEKLKREGK